MCRKRREALARLQATLPKDVQTVAARMKEIRGRHCSTARDDLIKKRIREMKASLVYSVASDEEKKRKILFVAGESNSGKTTLVDFALANYPAFRQYETSDGVPAKPLVQVRAPMPCTLRNLAIKLLEALGFPVKPDIKESKAWLEVERQLRYRRTIFLVIEETQRMLKMDDERELQKVSDTLINLVDNDDWPIRLILVGVEPLLALQTRYDQMKNRSRAIALGRVAKVERGAVDRRNRHHPRRSGTRGRLRQ
jgi:pantothenate kinase